MVKASANKTGFPGETTREIPVTPPHSEPCPGRCVKAPAIAMMKPAIRTATPWLAAPLLLALAAAGLLADAVQAPAAAQGARLDGTWNGSGRLILGGGNSERARCRATFRRQAARTFAMSAICATSSARIVQVASVQQVGTGRYTGRFYNREYDITGTIRISLRGNRMSAYLTGGSASAALTLTR